MLLDASMSENTKTVYQNALKCFKSFRQNYSMPNIWPVPTAHLASFVSFCFNQNYSPATVTTYMSSISFIHKLKNMDDPTCSFIIKKMLEGFRRLRSIRDVRLPITKELLVKICSALQSVCYSAYESILFKAAFCLAYFGLFRVGELVHTDQRQAGYAVQLADINVNSNALSVRIRRSKNNQSGKPIFLQLSSFKDDSVCPVDAINQFLQMRSSSSGNLFIHANGLPLTRYQFGAVLSKALTRSGIFSQNYKSHSFRIGRATTLAMSGVPDDQIKIMGRWQSRTYNKYIRLESI